MVVKKTLYNQIKNKKGDKTMKKVLLTSVAALAVFSAVVPAFADNNGGANLPGPYDSREAYESESEFVTADRVNEYVAAYSENINANKADLEKAQAELAKAENAPENFTHNRDELLAPYRNVVVAAQKAYDAEVAKVRNEAVKHLQEVFNLALKKEGKYYILNETPEQANARYLKDHAQDGQNGQTAPSATPEPGKPGAVEQAKQAEAVAKQADATAKAGQKALPKTHASK